ncbi:olfactory receptor 11A1-like [Myripristis murdjan]|uniref:Olfactory receptor n=1 Tax=Myripristis murdjan TaxID=586833 RepID=A0A667WT96_9TELE|nr:olfactory receptor 11A1-like [Myripristis murdjan]
MANSTQFSHFILSAYFDSGHLKYLFFTVILLLYVVVIISNFLLIAVICVNRSLHEPLYVLLCSLFVNELYGSAGLFPFLLLQILSDSHTVPTSLCFLQIYCLYTYGNIEFGSLALMSYDRYLAVCCPLHYKTHMTQNRVAVFIVVVWLFSFIKCMVTVVFTAHLLLCGNIINNLYCNNYLIMKLACSDPQVNNIYGMVNGFFSIVTPMTLILFSYTRILQICFAGSKRTVTKAVSTCTPHLASLMNFFFGVCSETLLSRLDMSALPQLLRVVLSLYFLIVQPLFNPFMYGMRMSRLRKACKNLLRCLA